MKKKHYALGTLIAVGGYGINPAYGTNYGTRNNYVEVLQLFTAEVPTAEWLYKKRYPYAEDIRHYSILAVKKTFVIFGGYSEKRRVLTYQKMQHYESFKKFLIHYESFSYYCKEL